MAAVAAISTGCSGSFVPLKTDTPAPRLAGSMHSVAFATSCNRREEPCQRQGATLQVCLLLMPALAVFPPGVAKL